MENKIITPTQLWSNYDPLLEPLRPSFLNCVDNNNYTSFDIFINGDKYDNDNVRIYINAHIPKIVKGVSVIFIGGYFGNPNQNLINSLLKQGVSFFSFDYSGEQNKPYYTKYPKEISYCNIAKAGDHLKKAIPTSQDTCIFNWCKLARKVINLVKQMNGDDTKIILIGAKEGADIAIQTAAVDNRIDGLVSILNMGWKEYMEYSEFDSSKTISLDDERKRWFVANATHSYVKFINCPTLFLGSTNSNFTSVDRLDNALNLIRQNNIPVYQSLCPGLTSSVTDNEFNLLLKWIKSYITSSTLPVCPDLAFSINNENELIANVNFYENDPIQEITLYYAYDEIDSILRNWKSISLSLSSKNCQIPVFDNTKLVCAYISVKYKGDYTLSSLPEYCVIKQNKRILTQKPKKTKIIYQKNLGIQSWYVDNINNTFEEIKPIIKTGGLDINGISAQNGDLFTYSIQESGYQFTPENLLKFDLYSSQDRDVTIVITAGIFGSHHNYYSTVHVNKDEWTKCSLKVTDFKSSSLVPLKSWSNIKKLTIKNINGAVLTNVLWV